MPQLVVYAAGSPFLRTRRAEYRYPPVSLESEEPFAPLLEPEVYDAEAVVLVADIYSIWPEVGGHRASSYSEMLRLLESYMSRSCSRRLPPRLCSRVAYRVYPWRGSMGGWVFDAQPGDAALYFALHAARAIVAAYSAPPGRRPRRVFNLYTGEQHPWQARLQEIASTAAALALRAELVEAVQEPHPYPRGRTPPLIDTVEHRVLAPSSAAARLVNEAPSPGPLFRGRGPHSPRIPRHLEKRIVHFTRAAVHARNCDIQSILALLDDLPSPLEALAGALDEAARLYEQATLLTRRRRGGRVAHSLAVNHDTVVAALAGAAILHAVRDELAAAGWKPGQPPQPQLLEHITNILGYCSARASGLHATQS